MSYKKTNILLFVALLLILSLCCSSCSKEHERHEDNEYDSSNSAEIIEDNEVVVTKVGNDSSIPSYMTSAKTSHGIYTLAEWPIESFSTTSPWIHCGNIVYVDYETGQKIYLCNNPGCSHNTEECQSYIKYPGSCTLFVNMEESKLYCMAYGAENGEIFSEDDYGRIYEMNMDGTERRELTVLNPNQCFSMQDAVFSSKDKLFVGLFETDSVTQKTDHILVSIDIKSGVLNEVYRLSVSDVLLQMDKDNEIVIQSLDSSGVHVREQYLQTAKSNLLFESTEISPLVVNDNIITCKMDGTSAIVTAQNYKTQAQKVITIEEVYTNSPLMMFCFVDGKIHLSYLTEKQEVKELYIDLESGSVWNKELTYDSYGEKRYIQIVSCLNSRYLVIGNYKEKEVTITDENGIARKYNILSPQLAFIDKEDYWQNIADYEWIEDKT